METRHKKYEASGLEFKKSQLWIALPNPSPQVRVLSSSGHSSGKDTERLTFCQSPPAGRLLLWRAWQLQQGVLGFHLGTRAGLEFINSTKHMQQPHTVLCYSTFAQEVPTTTLGRGQGGCVSLIYGPVSTESALWDYVNLSAK